MFKMDKERLKLWAEVLDFFESNDFLNEKGKKFHDWVLTMIKEKNLEADNGK
jgi:hypothetical protein